MSTLFQIRAVERGDIPAIAGLLNALNRSEGYNVVTEEAGLERAFFERPSLVDVRALVAYTVDGVVGVVAYYPGYDTLSASVGFHLADIVVGQGYRGHGVGRMLFTALARQALEEKHEWVSLTVLRKNEDARGFYKALGMTQVEVDFFAIGTLGLTGVINAK